MEKESKRSRGAIIMMLILIVGIAAVLIYAYIRKNSTYTSAELINSLKTEEGALIIRCDRGYILYDRDGAEAHSADGNAIWNISYNYTDPVAAVCGDMAVFADRGSQTFCVTDGEGSNYPVTVPEKIVDVRISKLGSVAVRTDASRQDHIYIYSMTGELLLDIATSIEKAGFPVAMAFSPDGRKLVASYIKVGEKQENKLVFYNFGEVGQSYSDKIVGSFSYGEDPVPEIRFINDESLCAFTENSCTFYKLKEIPEELKSIRFTGPIVGAGYDTSNVAIATYGTDGAVHIGIYTPAGERNREIVTGVDFDSIIVENNEIILTSQASLIIFRINGKEKFCKKLDDTIRYAWSTENDREYIIAGSSSVDTIRLRTEKEDEEEKTKVLYEESGTAEETPEN